MGVSLGKRRDENHLGTYIGHVGAEVEDLGVGDGLVDLATRDGEALEVDGKDHGRLIDGEGLFGVDELLAPNGTERELAQIAEEEREDRTHFSHLYLFCPLR